MGDQITVKPVRSAGDRRAFIFLQWKIYRGPIGNYPAWVAPLVIDEKAMFNTAKNPFYKHAEQEDFLAYDGTAIVGRISATVDRNYIDYHQEKIGFFGFFESADDPRVARALVDTATDWLRSRGMTRVIGPVNHSPNQMLGVLVDNFDTPPVIKMAYTPPYYPALLEQCGLSKAKDLVSYIMTTELALSDKITRVQALARKRYGITLRDIHMKDWDGIVDMVREIWNDAWSDNWGFVPWTKEEFHHAAADMKLIVEPRMLMVAYVEGEPAGFAFPIPDVNEIFHTMNGRLLPFGIFKLLLNKSKISRTRIAAFGIKKKFQNRGIDGIFVYELYTRGVKLGLTGAEFSWILEDNLDLRNMLEAWGTRHYKTHRVYGKDL